MSATLPPSRWHGFHRWVDFVRATISLGGVLVLGLWAVLTWALDERYLPAEEREQIRQNALSVKALQENLTTLSDVLVGEAVFGKRMAMCDAKDPMHRRELERQLALLIRRYTELTGQQPYLPTCQ